MYHHSFKLSFRYRNHTLISHNFLIRTYQLLLMCLRLPRSLVQNLQPSKLLRSLWIQNPMVSYRSAFAIGGSKSRTLPSRYARGPSIFFATNLRERNWENFAFREFRLSHEPTPRASSKKCILLDITYLTIHVDAGAMAFTRRKYLPPRLAAETCRRDISARRAKTHNTT